MADKTTPTRSVGLSYGSRGIADHQGKDWSPKSPIEFSNPLPADAAKTEVLRYTAERDMMDICNSLEQFGIT